MTKKKAESVSVGPLLHIGPDKGDVGRIGDLVLSILDKPVGDNVRIAAIEAVSKAFTIQGVTVHGCTFSGADQAVSAD